jgi:hypothetical protein
LWQELERRARERYVALDRLDVDLHWYRGQYEALDALIEAMRSPDRWLAYRAEALLDLPPEQGAQAAEGVSVVERVQTTLVSETTRCAGLERTWRGRAPLRRHGRWRSSPPTPSSNRAVRRSRRLRG